MKKLLGLSLLLVILLAACGNKVGGTYVNKKEHVTLVANNEKKQLVLAWHLLGRH
ncbi:hypothetical protein [Staphylococcus carnosus]|uniref:Membrane protein n=1 Tax=Staphylococcus carnosus (strain TM300) TaxID=396513 RepID=B9DKV2_STACT|nr:hypothetical protein [Staphylococcus carnosus]QPT03303.1 hypothetical protein I6G40_09450 [Staphylococcus carnosus]UQA68307.1 hypothetical protein Sta3580_05480 [Staphylococcus carnosus]CAL27114.1 putative membrane protein [Staphylococcus carnosus subsp. carnosus TM300]SUL91474.1 Uncharacterised protein [Staphylococcus carnosus]GEP75717.1 hypothetical protein SCA04_00310 [Staphylococcus carnosus]